MWYIPIGPRRFSMNIIQAQNSEQSRPFIQFPIDYCFYYFFPSLCFGLRANNIKITLLPLPLEIKSESENRKPIIFNTVESWRKTFFRICILLFLYSHIGMRILTTKIDPWVGIWFFPTFLFFSFYFYSNDSLKFINKSVSENRKLSGCRSFLHRSKHHSINCIFRHSKLSTSNNNFFSSHLVSFRRVEQFSR